MSSEAVQKKLEELRAQKKGEEESTRQKEEDKLRAKALERQAVIVDYTKRLEEAKVLWEAEVLLQFESFDINSIRNGFTHDKTLDQYVGELLIKYRFPTPFQNTEEELKRLLRNNFNWTEFQDKKFLENEFNTFFVLQKRKLTEFPIIFKNHGEKPFFDRNQSGYEIFDFKNDVIQQYTGYKKKGIDNFGNSYLLLQVREMPYKVLYDLRFNLEYGDFKGAFAKKKFQEILEPTHIQRVKEKLQKEQEIQAEKDKEKLERQLKAFQYLENLATNHCSYTTYQPLKNIDYNKVFSIHVLKKSKDNSGDWYHYKLDYHGVSQTSGGGYNMDGPVAEMTDWFEKGLVPFCIKCPICSNFTKFNFVIIDRSTPYQQSISKHPNFKEVYCPGHYFFNTRTNTHYISGGTEVIHIQRENPGEQARRICWEPDELLGAAPLRSVGQVVRDNRMRIGWKIWDPQDPDGSKQREREREKEKQDLQNQIALLQQKLQSV